MNNLREPKIGDAIYVKHNRENGLVVGPFVLLSVNEFGNWLALYLINSETVLLYANEVRYVSGTHYTGFVFHENINS